VARILYVSQSYSTHDRRFLELLAQLEDEVWFLPCESGGNQAEIGPVPKRIHRLPPLTQKNCAPFRWSWVCAAVRFCRLVRTLKTDLVHAGSVQTGGFFAALAGVHPFLITSWGSDVLSLAESSFLMKSLTKFSLRRADMALGDCEVVRERISALSSLSPEEIICFPWGISKDSSHHAHPNLGLRKAFGWQECKVIVSARSLEQVHGTMNFVRAMERIVHQRADIRVLMLGDGSLMGEVMEFVRSHRISDKFHFAGHVPEERVRDYLAETDIYVSAAPCDGTSISLLQAMGCGLPVVVADAGGNREWVREGENGWLYSPGDLSAFVAAISTALENSALWSAMGGVNVKSVKARADWEQNSRQLLLVYDRLLRLATAKEAEVNAEFQNR
jgi:glycosyltransferase involved in cell wall biosynthesis